MSKRLNDSKRYRILGFVASADGGYTSKGETIFLCDTFDDALEHLKKIHHENIECTFFTIERGEWL